MTEVTRGNAVVGQSGGPTAVINQSLIGVIRSVAACGAIDRLLGARHGVRGIIEENFIDLGAVDADTLELLAGTPCAALGSTRDKPDEEYCQKIFEVFAKNNVRYFFYIGGNDTAETARIISELAAETGYELRVFHIPKTIDNDLRVTDHCPGYGSAARFVAAAIMGDDRDSASLPGIKVDVLMGRHAGWLTASSILARRDETDGPHLVYVPEAPVTQEQFVNDVAEVYSRLGRCLIAVSEGIEREPGRSWGEWLAASGERDSFGNIRLSGNGTLGDYLADVVRTKVVAKVGARKIRVRADTFGYLQRSFAGFASPVDQAEARLAGQTAVQYAMAGDRSGSVAFRRTGQGEDYAIECFRAELVDVACETKPLPAEYINAAGNNINESFLQYVTPLVGELPVIAKLT